MSAFQCRLVCRTKLGVGWAGGRARRGGRVGQRNTYKLGQQKNKSQNGCDVSHLETCSLWEIRGKSLCLRVLIYARRLRFFVFAPTYLRPME